MNTPDSPESIEAWLAEFMQKLPDLMKGKTPEQKQKVLANLFGEVHISLEHTPFWYWTVSSHLWSGIFSLEWDTFLEFREGKWLKKYFPRISSKGIIELSDGTYILTISIGWDRIGPRRILRIEEFCYVEDGAISTFHDLPNPCSLEMATTIFLTKKNEEISRKNSWESQ